MPDLATMPILPILCYYGENLKVHLHQAKAKMKAKNFFDVWKNFFVLFR